MNVQMSRLSQVSKTIRAALVVSIFCLPALMPLWAEEPEAGARVYHKFDGGTEKIDLKKHSKTDAEGKTVIDFYGQNLTGKKICDFEFELAGVKEAANIKRIKVSRIVEETRNGKKKEKELKDADWDVDDNMDGSSQGDPFTDGSFGKDEDAPGGKANECDNLDDSPQQRARVDNKGPGPRGCCWPHAAESAAAAAEPRDEAEGELSSGFGAAISPKKGRNKFRIQINLTAKAEPKKEGVACVLLVTATGEGGMKLGFLPGGLKLGENYCAVRYLHPSPGIVFTLPNDTGRRVVELDIKPKGNLTVTGLAETDSETGDTLNVNDCAKKTAHGSYRLPLLQPVDPGKPVTVRVTCDHFDDDGGERGLVITPMVETKAISFDWPGIDGLLCTFIPSGENYGDIGDIVITNISDDAVTVTVPEGLLIDSAEARVQDLYVAKVPTETPCSGAEEMNTPITISPGKAYAIKHVPGFCPDFELSPPEKGATDVYTVKQPDEKSKTLLATIEAVKDFDVSSVKLEAFGEAKARQMICQGALWTVDSRIDEVEGNDVTATALTDRYWGAFEASAKNKLESMTPKQREEAEKLVREDLKEIVAATSFVAKKVAPG